MVRCGPATELQPRLPFTAFIAFSVRCVFDWPFECSLALSSHTRPSLDRGRGGGERNRRKEIAKSQPNVEEQCRKGQSLTKRAATTIAKRR